MSSIPDPEPVITLGPATGEVALLAAVQRRLLTVPGAREAATVLSHVGEHALGWSAISAAGMLTQPARRGGWAMVGVGTVGAHAASVLLKRIVRRRRPHHPDVAVGVGTPSSLSFPSSHATSTTAFAVLAGGVTGLPVVPVLVPPMLASRLALGVHYPTDVAAGAVLGAACAAVTRRAWPTAAVQSLLPAFARDARTPTSAEENR